MENKSFLSKFLLLLIIVVLIAIVTFFVINKNSVDNNMNEIEKITSMNVDTFDEDLYVYKIDDTTLYTSEYFYNAYYLLNNYSLLKVYIWKNKDNSCKNILLYSSNNVELEYEQY